MPAYSARLRRLLADETLIDPHQIAELLDVAPVTVRKWYAKASSREAEHRRIRLPDSNPADAVRREGEPRGKGPATPRWPTRVIVEWAVDPLAPNGGMRLDYDGNPIVRRSRR